MKTNRVAVSHQVEPPRGPMLAKTRAGDQLVYELGVRRIARIAHIGSHLLIGWR